MTTTASSDHTAPDGQSVPVSAAAMVPAAPRTLGSGLGPEEYFPEDLSGLGMATLQVLHSRITRQLDHDYLTDPAGPHTDTMDRRQELRPKLDVRDAL